MEVRIYDENLDLVQIVENYSSLIWTRGYNTCGSFSIKAPLIEQNINALKIGRIVSIKGKPEAGLIENLTLSTVGFDSDLTATGRFLDAIMDRRLVYPKFTFSGNVEGIMREMFSQAKSFPGVVLGTSKGYTETMDSMQATYKSLLTYEQNLAQSVNYGIRFVPDFTNKTITFDIYKGVDRSLNQSDRPRVVFSDEYENLSSITYKNNDQLLKTVCVVGGQGEETYKVYETVGDTGSSGFARRETYYEASDVSSEGLTWAQYIAALRSRGQLVLDQSKESETFECTIRMNGNFIYEQDYNVGDVVSVSKEAWGLEKDYRVTEAREIYETEVPKVELTLGTPLPTTINWEV